MRGQKTSDANHVRVALDEMECQNVTLNFMKLLGDDQPNTV